MFSAGLVALTLMSGCTSTPEAGPASPGALSPGPAASPRPTLIARQTVYVGNTDRYGADFRQAPGSAGARIRVLPDGAVLEATGRSQQVDEQTWSELRDSTGVVGWVVLDYLNTAPPPLATPTPVPALSAPPPTLTLIPLPSTTPEATAGPRPTDTLVPLAPPRQAPALAPIPPPPTPRPDLPTVPPMAPAGPTITIFDRDPTPTLRQGGTVVPTRRPAGP